MRAEECNPQRRLGKLVSLAYPRPGFAAGIAWELLPRLIGINTHWVFESGAWKWVAP